MTELPKSAGKSALRFSTAGEAIAYVGKHNLSRVEADPIFDANEIDRDDAWAMVEKARAAEKVAYFEEGRRARERLAALEASRQPVAKPKPQAEREDFFSSSAQPRRVEDGDEEELPTEAEPAQAEPEPEPEPEPKAALPAVIPLTPTVGNIWDQALAEMNRVHAVIESVGGKTVIASWEPSPKDESRMELVYQAKEHFLLRYSNKFISYPIPNMRGGVKQESVPVGLWWLNNVNRRQFRGVMFRPGASPEVNNCLNLWQGWGVEDRAGDWGLLRNHILKVICNGNRDFAVYVLRWIAWSIQHPDAPAEVALVLIGQKGTGKGTLVRCLERIFKPHSFQVSDREDVIGKFNGHLEDVVLFIADEAYWGGDKRCIGRLQGMITEPELPIQHKGFNTKKVPNYLHVLMLAEPGWVVPAGKHERRYAVLSVSDKHIGDVKYFTALRNEIANGGAEGMFHDLRRIDLGDWHPRQIPETLLHSAAIQRQQSKTLPPLEKYYAMLLHEAKLPGPRISKKPNRAMTRDLVEDAIKRVPRLKFELDEWSLRDFLTDTARIGEACTQKHFTHGNGYLFPPLAIARAAWEQLYGPTIWDQEAEEWG
jgi:energy-coupling factor transporter ATP-binding protein EcfA2